VTALCRYAFFVYDRVHVSLNDIAIFTARSHELFGRQVLMSLIVAPLPVAHRSAFTKLYQNMEGVAPTVFRRQYRLI
jgi:hypothetical protein